MSAVELETPIIGPTFPSLGFIKASSSSLHHIPRSSPAPFSAADASIAPTLLDLPFSFQAASILSRQQQQLQPPSYSPAPQPHSQQQQQQQLASPATVLHAPISQSRKRKRSPVEANDADDDEDDDGDDENDDEDELPPAKQQQFVHPDDVYQAQSFTSANFTPPFNFVSPIAMSQQRYTSYNQSSSGQGSQQPVLPSQAAAARRTSAPGSTAAGRSSSSSAHLAAHSSSMYRSSGSEPPVNYSAPQSSSYYGSQMYDTSGYGMGYGNDYSSMTASPMSSVAHRPQLPHSSYQQQQQQQQQRYMPALSYPPAQSHGASSYAPRPGHSQAAVGASPEAQRQKPRCWEHGCNGREFSTFSNLLRHQREKSGTAAKSYCPRCGAEFTRSTAMANHLQQAKCKPRPGAE